LGKNFTITHIFVIMIKENIDREEGPLMAKTVVKENESIEDALRRFKRDVSRSGTLQEARKREFYVKPSISKKLRRKANQKRR